VSRFADVAPDSGLGRHGTRNIDRAIIGSVVRSGRCACNKANANANAGTDSCTNAGTFDGDRF
jgi:hypothetical protein